jgi:hypothetical protein
VVGYWLHVLFCRLDFHPWMLHLRRLSVLYISVQYGNWSIKAYVFASQMLLQRQYPPPPLAVSTSDVCFAPSRPSRDGATLVYRASSSTVLSGGRTDFGQDDDAGTVTGSKGEWTEAHRRLAPVRQRGDDVGADRAHAEVALVPTRNHAAPSRRPAPRRPRPRRRAPARDCGATGGGGWASAR